MRKSYSNQLRLDSASIEQVALNLESHDRIVPVLRALQFVYVDRSANESCLTQWFDLFTARFSAATPTGSRAARNDLVNIFDRHQFPFCLFVPLLAGGPTDFVGWVLKAQAASPFALHAYCMQFDLPFPRREASPDALQRENMMKSICFSSS